jgi:HEAT repeat protein
VAHVSLFPPSRTITVDAALRDVAQGSPKARVLAAHALGDARDDRDRALPALIRALDDDRAEVRAEAASSLGVLCAADDPQEVGDARAVEPLAKRLTDGDAQVRQNAAIALGTLRHPDAFDAIATALSDGPNDTRYQAATSLAEIDPARAYDPLVAALGDKDPQVLGAVALSLGALGEARAADHLARLLEHREPPVRFDAAYALAELGDARGRSVLATAVVDTEASRAWDAACALEWLGTADDARALAALLGRRKADPNTVLRAAGAILRIAQKATLADDLVSAARRTLLAGLGARKVPLRGLAVQELATGGGVWAIPPLEQLRGTRRGRQVADEIDDALRLLKERP